MTRPGARSRGENRPFRIAEDDAPGQRRLCTEGQREAEFLSTLRRGLFAPLPAVKAPSNSERSEDPVLSRAIDFWFLCCEDGPVICLETSGHAYSTKGLTIELQPEYAKRRNIYDIVAEIHTRFLTGTAHLLV
jgi:hypothetical protein